MPDLFSMQKTETPTVTALGRLVARMALDDALHRAYLDDPEAVIDSSGLSPAEAQALRDGDWSAIVRLLGPKDRPVPTDPPSKPVKEDE